MKKNNSKKYSKQLIAIAIALVLLIGGTYAWLRITINGTKTNILRAGTLQLTLDDTTSDGIDLTNSVPMSDTKGLTTTAYTFTLKNSGSSSADYTIYLDDLGLDTNEIRMNDKYVKYSLVKNSGTVTTALLTTTGVYPNRLLDSGTINANTTNSYTLRLWIDSSADNEVMGTVFYGQLRVDATNQVEDNSLTTE